VTRNPRRSASAVLLLAAITVRASPTSADAFWVTGWRPKGFERFFRDFGIPAQETMAQEKSVADQVVQNVLKKVERYGMYLVN